MIQKIPNEKRISLLGILNIQRTIAGFLSLATFIRILTIITLSKVKIEAINNNTIQIGKMNQPTKTNSIKLQFLKSVL